MNLKNFKNTWEKALIQEGLSLVVIKSNRVLYGGNISGMSGLLECLEKGHLAGSEVYDTKIGLAAAKLLVWGGADTIHTLVASEAAIKFCRDDDVKLDYKDGVKRLYTSEDFGGCLYEKMAFKSSSLDELVDKLKLLREVRLGRCPKTCVFPLDYYSTSNRKTYVNFGEWITVQYPEMDKAILVNRQSKTARTVASCEVKQGDWVVVGNGEGVYEEEIETSLDEKFRFMSSEVSGERPKEALVAQVADLVKANRSLGKRTLFIGGPAIVHTGSGKFLAALIREGWINVVFGGNAIATHDLEENYLGTSLGTQVKTGERIEGGHHHHLRTVNMVRYYGGIKRSVENSMVKSGIFYECVQKSVKFVLAGSIRDDGPLTDVITDAVEAQMAMREETRKGFGLAVMVATTLHSVATGNLLPYETRKVIVDDNLAAVTKLADRGTNAMGIVTDCAYFLSQLCSGLEVRV